MPPPKQPTATEFGIAVLSARSLPEKKLREKLASRYAADETDAAISRLRELRMVDDAAWAERFVRDRFERAGKGRHRIRVDLVARGIDAATADAAVANVIGVEDELARARAALDQLRRRAPSVEAAGALELERSRARIFRKMMSRGFPATLIRQLLNVS